MLRHIGRLDGVDPLGADLGASDGKDAAPGAHIKNHLVAEVASVAEDGGAVGVHTDAVAENLLLAGRGRIG